MIGSLPTHVSIVFVLTTLAAIGFVFAAVRPAGRDTLPIKLITFYIPFWLVLTGILAVAGFYREFDVFPPRVAVLGVLPTAVVLLGCLFLFRRQLVERVSLRALTMLHVVRLPVEIVLLWLFQGGLVPREMTFEGWNFDILSGLTAPIVYWLAFRRGATNRPLLIGWNVAALLLLANIVTIAILSFRSPMQQVGFDQPNVGVTYLPFIWLPALVVPIVLFAHVASLMQILGRGRRA
ncbi:MAG: hypothetical protein ACK4S4_13875 [Pyrinomonadaceae bacterium]